MLKQLPAIDPNSEAFDGPSDEERDRLMRRADDADLEAARISWEMMQERKRYRGFANRKPLAKTKD